MTAPLTPSPLYARLSADTLQARKGRVPYAPSMVLVLATASRIAKDAQRGVTDEDVMKALKTTLAGLEETCQALGSQVDQTAAGGDVQARLDMAMTEIRVFTEYLPQQLPGPVLTGLIRSMAEAGSSKKEVMVRLKAEYPGQYDGKAAADIFDSLSKSQKGA